LHVRSKYGFMRTCSFLLWVWILKYTITGLHVHASTRAAAGTCRLAHFPAASYSVQSASSWVSAVRDTAKCALRAASMHTLFQNMLQIPALDHTTSLWAWGSS